MGPLLHRISDFDIFAEYHTCGKRPLYKDPAGARIIQGSNAQPYTIPWQVEVTINNTNHACGASIIDPHWIVTAGHCVDEYSAEMTGTRVLRLAEYDRVVFEGYEEYVIPDQIHRHPGYVIGDPKTPGYYDIALLHLKERLQFSDRIQPVCLPSENTELKVGKKCMVSGWGKTSANPNATYAKILQQLKVTILLNLSSFNCCYSVSCS